MRPLLSTLSAIRQHDGGATAIIFAIMILVLCAGAGAAIDYGRMARVQGAMQTALDASLLAAVRQDKESRIGTAVKAFNENLTSDNLPAVDVNFVNKNDSELSGKATADLGATLLAAIGFKSFMISVEATAIAEGGGKVCVLVLDPAASQSLLVNSGATVSAPDCEIHVRSNGSPAAIFNAGSDIDSKRLCIAGHEIIDNGGDHPNLSTSCEAANDPFSGMLPEPPSATCDFTNQNYNGGEVSLKPGVYCGWTNFNAGPDVTLDPGVYVIRDGGWNVNGGTWTGSGVVFYFADQSKIQFNSAVAAKLTPPTSGSWKDVIIFEKEGLSPSPFVIDDSKGFDIIGIVHLPSRDTILNSSSNAVVRDLTMVVKTLILDDTNWTWTSSTAAAGADGQKSVRLIN